MSEIAFQTGAMQGEQRKKRVLTDARKAQNRLAQRAFRKFRPCQSTSVGWKELMPKYRSETEGSCKGFASPQENTS